MVFCRTLTGFWHLFCLSSNGERSLVYIPYRYIALVSGLEDALIQSIMLIRRRSIRCEIFYRHLLLRTLKFRFCCDIIHIDRVHEYYVDMITFCVRWRRC